MKLKHALFALLFAGLAVFAAPSITTAGDSATSTELVQASGDAVTSTATAVVSSADETPVPDPVDIGLVAFSTFAAMALIVMPVTGWIKTALKISGGTQVLSWVVSIAIAYTGYALKLGILADAGPISTAIYGLAAGLVANGIADIGIVQGLLIAIGAKVPKSK